MRNMQPHWLQSPTNAIRSLTETVGLLLVVRVREMYDHMSLLFSVACLCYETNLSLIYILINPQVSAMGNESVNWRGNI